jgi:activator of HSP90 ATPase
MADHFEISTELPARPDEIFRAWLDEGTHAAMVGASARIVPEIGGEFQVWDGYITGRTLALDPPRRIVQAWRTTEFSASDPDSRLELILEPSQEGTRLTLRHTDIPEGQGSNYEEGWESNYFSPMRTYFSKPRP